MIPKLEYLITSQPFEFSPQSITLEFMGNVDDSNINVRAVLTEITSDTTTTMEITKTIDKAFKDIFTGVDKERLEFVVDESALSQKLGSIFGVTLNLK